MAIQFGGNQGEMRLVLKVRDDGSVVIDKFADNVDKSAKKSGKAFDDFASGAGINFRSVATYAGVAAAAVVAGSVAMIKHQIDVADAAVTTAEKLGLSVEALTAFHYVAEQARIPVQTLEMALQRMTRRVAEAGQGAGEAKDALKELGLDAQQLARLSPDQQYLAIAEALSHIPTQADRVRLAFKLFDSEGVAMVNTMRQGRRGIEEVMQRAKELGLVIDSDTARASREFNTQIIELQANLRGFAIDAIPPTIAAVKGIAHVVYGVSAGFQSLGRAIGAVSAAAVETAKLNFSQAGAILRQYAEDRKQIEAELKETLDKLWADPPPLPQLSPEGASTGGGWAREQAAAEAAAKAAAEAAQARREAWLEEQQLRREVMLQMEAEEIAREQAAIAEQVRLASRVETLRNSLLTERELIAQHEADKQLLLFESWEARLVTDQEYEMLRTQITQQAADQRAAIEQRTTDQIRSLQTSVVQNAIGLLQVLAGQNKAAAVLSITISKTMAIAQTLAHTKTAAMLAFASQLVPGDPTSIARAKAAYAWTMKLGALNAALIGAQGIAEIASLGKDGAERGSAANPVHTAPAVAPFQQSAPAPSQTITQVIFYGDVVGSEHFVRETLVPILQDEIGNKDVVIITPGSRQAAELHRS